MVRQWALRFRDEANERALSVTRHGLSHRERAHEAAAAHWHTYRHRLAEMISVSQLAMINDDFAQYWAEMCAIPISFIAETVRRAQAEGYCAGDDPQLIAEAIVAMFNQFCYIQLSRDTTRRTRRSGLHPDAGQHLLPSHLLARRSAELTASQQRPGLSANSSGCRRPPPDAPVRADIRARGCITAAWDASRRWR